MMQILVGVLATLLLPKFVAGQKVRQGDAETSRTGGRELRTTQFLPVSSSFFPSSKTKKGSSSKKSKKSKDECREIDEEESPTLTVSEINEQGFDDFNNKYALGMATFNDFVYVGTLNAPGFPADLLPWFSGAPLDSTGAKVFRGKPNKSHEWKWKEVLDFGEAPRNSNNFGVRKMTVVGDYLYLVTANHQAEAGNGVEVWSTIDGENWVQKNDPGFGVPENISGRSIAECGGYLYIGAENRATGAQLWRHVLGAGGDITGNSWELVSAATDGFGNPTNYFIAELTKFQEPNVLYASTLNGFDGMELWKVMSCDAVPTVASVFTGGWPEGPVPCPLPQLNIPRLGPINLCVTNSGALTLETAMTSLGPALFLGTVNYVLGASLFVTFDGMNFIPIFIFGNGDARQSYVWSMEEYNGRLYVGTFQRPNLLNLFGVDLTGIAEFSSVAAAVDRGNEKPFEADMPPLPGITGGVVPEASGADVGASVAQDFLDNVVESGDFSLLSLDLSEFTLFSLPSVITETSDGFGNCYSYGIRTMTKYEDKLILGTAGASSRGGASILEATPRDDSKSKSGKGGKGGGDNRRFPFN